MEPETKKKIAHVLGWTEVHIIEFLDPLVMGLPPKNDLPLPEEFNPETNDTQLWECLDYLISNDWDVGKDNYDYIVFSATVDDIIQYKGKTLKAAVIAALNEMFGNRECI